MAEPSAAPLPAFIPEFIADYVLARGTEASAPVGLWPGDLPLLTAITERMAAPAAPALAGDGPTVLHAVVGVPPGGWHPREHPVDARTPAPMRDDPANVDIVRACHRLSADGVGLFVVAPGFALRAGRQTALPTLARLGVHVEAVVELPRGIFRPDTGSGRWLIAFSRRPPAAPVVGALRPGPHAGERLLARVAHRDPARPADPAVPSHRKQT